MCIKNDEQYYECQKAQLNEETIIWVNSVKHLGNIINYIVIKLMCNIVYCLNCSKYFCTSYHGSSVWNFFFRMLLKNYYVVEYSCEKSIIYYLT